MSSKMFLERRWRCLPGGWLFREGVVFEKKHYRSLRQPFEDSLLGLSCENLPCLISRILKLASFTRQRVQAQHELGPCCFGIEFDDTEFIPSVPLSPPFSNLPACRYSSDTRDWDFAVLCT